MPLPSFNDLLDIAAEQLELAFKEASASGHNPSVGSHREDAMRTFLEARLPSRFGVTSGTAMDSGGRRSGQLDIAIYDRNMTGPIVKKPSSDVLPAESLLAVIEVKSKLTSDELAKAVRSANKVAALRPYGSAFVPIRTDGMHADDGAHRCLYSVVARTTETARKDWDVKEWAKVTAAAGSEGLSTQIIDRVLVLDRGMLLPPSRKSVSVDGTGRGMLRSWFVQTTNFLVREANRRPAFDFEQYGRTPTNANWSKLP